MSPKRPRPNLREAAEANLAGRPAAEAPVRSTEALLHELQVHQIELEMQNQELREAQVALEESRDRFVDFYEFAPAGYLTLTDRGLIANINSTGASLLGVVRGKLMQKRFARFIGAEDADLWHSHFFSVLKQDEKLDCELTLQKGDGSRISARLDSLRLVKEGQPPTVRIVLIDITQRKRAEESLRQANALLATQYHRLEQANQSRAEFMNNVTHELRTPLNAVIGFSELLKDEVLGPLNAQQAECAADILASGLRLLALVNGILEMSRLDAAGAAIELEPVDIGAALEERVAAQRKAAEARSIAIELEVAPDAGSAELDPQALRRILDALIDNAIKFNRDGGTVAASARRNDDWLEIAVANTGIGIAREDLAKLFKPLTQLDAGLARQHEGVGLGLALARRLADRHGGTIEVESEPGTGSRFTLRLPLREKT